MNRNKLAFFAAAATLTFAGAAFAQSATAMPTPGQQAPATTTGPAPGAFAQPSADASAAPASAVVASDFQVGAEVKDPSGVPIGVISGTSTAADGSVNVVITQGAVKFALPANSLSSSAEGLTTTATKAQIDATLAGAKPQ